jgi:hypothetical protein
MKVNFGPYPEVGEQQVEVHIDEWDTWNMDDTLAHIILPMLKQLKETKHGAPAVSLKDVPESLWPVGEKGISKLYTHSETDENYFKRWDYVLDEMIWAFEQKTSDEWKDQFYGPFIDDPEKTLGGEFEWIDTKGLKEHQNRMTNGFKLFGKYYENLWD